jgi:hypothetical protein
MERTPHPGPPPTSLPPSGRRRWASAPSVALLALAACACTPAGTPREAAPPSPAYGTAMNATTLSMSAEDVSRRMLRLFTSVRGPDDITPARIRELTEIEVRYGNDDPKQYGFGEAVDDTWIYNLVSLPGPDGKPNRLMFSFDDQSHGHADMAPVCALGFDDYAKALTDAGRSSLRLDDDRQRLRSASCRPPNRNSKRSSRTSRTRTRPTPPIPARPCANGWTNRRR